LYFPFRDESLIQNGHADIKQALLSKRNEIEKIDKNDNCLLLLNKKNELQLAIEKIILLDLLEPEIELSSELNFEQISIIQDELIEIETDDNFLLAKKI